MSSMVNIDVLRGTPDSARLYKWDVQLQAPGMTNMLAFRATTIGQPQPTFNPIPVLIRGFTKVEAGAVDWQPLTFTAIEVDTYEILRGLYLWGKQQFDYRTGVQQSKSSYEGTSTILLEGVDDSVRATWKLTGCVLESFNPPDLGSDKAAVWDGFTFSVQFDYAELS